MMLKPPGLGALLLALSALPVTAPAPALAAPAVATPAAAAVTAAGASAAAPRAHTADQIGRFLARFYGKHGPSAHDRRHHVSQVLLERQANTQSDVLLCAQNEPLDIGIGPVTVAQAAAVGWATVTTHWEGDRTDTFTAYVRLDSKPIRIDDVICAG
ncbi:MULTISPECIES: hypothetical protein [unclassified Streptomyces]|uniref:hypothetical protein n=1 Tax=Streptomyces sp. NRRL F-4428 TaxID=1609137 RepID=UPI00069780F4|nr:hypothetical protein [Streptomyces sp. NRRL F-4428]